MAPKFIRPVLSFIGKEMIVKTDIDTYENPLKSIKYEDTREYPRKPASQPYDK